MKTIEVSETIAASADEVWAAVCDLDSWPERISSIERVERVSGEPLGVGSVFRETRVMMGREHTEEMTVAERDDAQRRVVFHAHNCGCFYHTVQRVDEAPGGGSVMTISFTGTPETFMAKIMGVIMAPMMKKTLIKCLRDDMADLKRALEGVSDAPRAAPA